MSGRHVWKSCVEEPDIYIGENYSNEHQITKKYTKDFLHPGLGFTKGLKVLRFLLIWDSQKVLSKILAETKFVQKVLTTLNSN